MGTHHWVDSGTLHHKTERCHFWFLALLDAKSQHRRPRAIQNKWRWINWNKPTTRTVSIGIDISFHHAHYNICNYLCMLELILNHVSKRALGMTGSVMMYHYNSTFTHWGRTSISDNLQTTFWKIFSSMERWLFWFWLDWKSSNKNNLFSTKYARCDCCNNNYPVDLHILESLMCWWRNAKLLLLQWTLPVFPWQPLRSLGLHCCGAFTLSVKRTKRPST